MENSNLIRLYLDRSYEYIVNYIWAKWHKMSPVSIDIWVDESINNSYIYDFLRAYCIMLIRCEKEPDEEVVIRIYEAPNNNNGKNNGKN